MLYWMVHESYLAKLAPVASKLPDGTEVKEPTAAEPFDVRRGVARIRIEGVLLNERDGLFDLFGIPQTAYADLIAQIAEADQSDEVDRIELLVNSGGGTASNMLVEAAQAIADAQKPVTAVVGDLAASAAYWIASQADEILLEGPASMVGSIGVAVTFRVSNNVVSIASTDAPRKRPDVTTEQGRADVRMELDALHDLFVSAVSAGRGVSADTVNRDFGRGGVLLASDALAVGMADGMTGTSPQQDARANVALMDIETLKRDHPDTYKAIVSHERDRVCAHLTLAEASGAMDTAVAHIREGKEPDATVQALHTAASIQAQTQITRKAAEAPDLSAGQPQNTATQQSTEDEACEAAFAQMIADAKKAK